MLLLYKLITKICCPSPEWFFVFWLSSSMMLLHREPVTFFAEMDWLVCEKFSPLDYEKDRSHHSQGQRRRRTPWLLGKRRHSVFRCMTQSSNKVSGCPISCVLCVVFVVPTDCTTSLPQSRFLVMLSMSFVVHPWSSFKKKEKGLGYSPCTSVTGNSWYASWTHIVWWPNLHNPFSIQDTNNEPPVTFGNTLNRERCNMSPVIWSLGASNVFAHLLKK